MKRLITFFLVALPMLLACDKPAQKIVIPQKDIDDLRRIMLE